MISYKVILATFMVLAISNSIVESCHSDSGTSSASSCSAGTFGLDCSDSCPCNSSLLITCIEKKCECNLKSQGGFGHTCNENCPCQKNAGLLCVSGTCKCNATTALWDNGECLNIETDAANCDALIAVSGGRKKRDLAVDESPFKTDASEKGWKCIASTKTLYGPSYSEESSTGKYVFEDVPATGYESYSNCSALGGERVQPSAGDDLETLLVNYDTTVIYIGVVKDNKDNLFYYDNSTLSNLELDNSDNGNCVTMAAGDPVVYTSADCADLNMYICQF